MSEASSQKSTAGSSTGSHSLSSGPAGNGSTPAAADGEATVISSRPPVPSLGRGQLAHASLNLLEGERLGQFLLQKFVGGGGMGIVFRALDVTLNRDVAVKVLSRDQSADEETLRRFRNEAQSAARLNHDNIARVHYVGEDRGVHYIVFEYIDGINIRDLVEQRGPLPLEEAVSYTYQIAQALEHASQRAVIHRDIKPSNVLVTPDGKAKLVDMGLARLNLVAPNDDLTASGVTLGTFDYISPEQARDPRSADVRSDLYSLGCSLFYMLTARPPFPDGTVLQKLLQHQADTAPDPRTLRPDLPAEVTRILVRLLAKNPANRYQQPGELIDELAALGESLGLQLSSSRAMWVAPRPARSIGRWQQHLPWAVPLVALFVIVIGLDFYWSSGAPELSPTTIAGSPSNRAPRIERSRSASPTKRAAEPAGAPAVEETPLAPEGPLSQAPPPPLENADNPARTRVPENGDTATAEAADPLAKQPFSVLQKLLRDFERLAAELKQEQWSAELSGDAAGQSQADAARLDPRFDGGVSSAAAPTDPSPTTLKPTINSVAREREPLVVGDEPGARSYATLHAACSEAKDGDTIELRYNGPREEKPIAISNLKLMIRAGQGFQPIVRFNPEPEQIPLKYLPTMVSVAGGSLTVSGVHWELDLPRNEPVDWALFEARRAERLQFDECVFTIRGQAAYHAGVAFFDIKSPRGTSSMAMDQTAMDPSEMDPMAAALADSGPVDEQTVAIRLRNCIARGEATLLRSNELQPVRVQWDNGLLATSERLLVAAGGSLQPRHTGRLQIQLRHVTALVQNGLALLTDSQDAPYQLATAIHCDDCIVLTHGKATLIEQRGADPVAEYLSQLQWSGGRTLFAGFDPFWRIVNTAGETGSKHLDFEAWQDFWRGQSYAQMLLPVGNVWKNLPDLARPCHALTLDDFTLDEEAPGNPAVGQGDGQENAGAMFELLPRLTPEEARDSGPARGSASSSKARDRDMP